MPKMCLHCLTILLPGMDSEPLDHLVDALVEKLRALGLDFPKGTRRENFLQRLVDAAERALGDQASRPPEAAALSQRLGGGADLFDDVDLDVTGAGQH